MQETELEESVVMDESEIDRTLVRMAHQILEQNKGCQNLALVGIVTRGDVLAHRLAKLIEGIEGTQLPVGSLDISFYRDDSILNIAPVVQGTNILFSLDGKTIVLVDDVLYTGRTIRAALDALMDFGRPARIQLATLVDIASFPSGLILLAKTFLLHQTKVCVCSLTKLMESPAFEFRALLLVSMLALRH